MGLLMSTGLVDLPSNSGVVTESRERDLILT